MFIQSIHRNVSDGCYCLKTKCSRDKEQNFEMQPYVLGWLFESFVIVVLLLIYINIHIIHRVWKLYLLHNVLAVGTV